MKEFSLKPVCSKCGCVIVTSEYTTEYLETCNVVEEAIIRQCSCCGYCWSERPLDFKDEKNDL